ncbi:hypothetical protein [uncultured Microbacterium sp.]|uniref:hypothetical protein n=1 Tax=uncultured Microbacterium sp. TaxID=191216 RepID=UPI0028DB31EE|nr:hypothetical protein [uncultured Microbacterium sp.]
MYETLHATQVVAEMERAQLDRVVERRRFLHEHADRIVPATPGFWGRMLRPLRRARRRPREGAAVGVRHSREPVAAR